MAIKINGQEPGKIMHNGQEVKRVYHDGVLMFKTNYQVTLYAGRSGSYLTARTAPSASSGSAYNIRPNTYFYVVGNTQENGFLPILYNQGLYYATAAYIQTNPANYENPKEVQTDRKVAICATDNKDLYDGAMSNTIIAKVMGYDVVEVLSEVQNGRIKIKCKKRTDGEIIEGWTQNNNYIQQVTDLSTINLQNYQA